ncbi:MAG TPA: sigma-54-dependent Fis family transcriptional regulator [candidate division Zixibacteria bacterium]|nr:sigma-54-dependent Fis family transcriptional regulator [candidate division Zixibacteria bacterium]
MEAQFGLVGSSQNLKKVKQDVENYASRKEPILIIGETGTGKQLVAKALHEAGLRKKQPFVEIDCNDYLGNSNALQSELFGHTKNAYTGAGEEKASKWEFAKKGTLFIDEIGDFPMEIQGKLLSPIEKNKIKRFGDNKDRDIDCRIIAATNKPEKDNYSLRRDLWDRFKLKIYLAPLRERKDDLIDLFLYFCDRECSGKKKIDSFEFPIIHILLMNDWPGNVRQLQNEVTNYIIDMKTRAKLGSPEIAQLWFEGSKYEAYFDLRWVESGVRYSPIVWMDQIRVTRKDLLNFKRKIPALHKYELEEKILEFLVKRVKKWEREFEESPKKSRLKNFPYKDYIKMDDYLRNALGLSPESASSQESTSDSDYSQVDYLAELMSRAKRDDSHISDQSRIFTASLDHSYRHVLYKFVYEVYKDKGTKARAAKSLGISYPTTLEYLKKYEIMLSKRSKI